MRANNWTDLLKIIVHLKWVNFMVFKLYLSCLQGNIQAHSSLPKLILLYNRALNCLVLIINSYAFDYLFHHSSFTFSLLCIFIMYIIYY